jgi:hypothetical protein
MKTVAHLLRIGMFKLNVEAAGPSETSVATYDRMWCHNTEDQCSINADTHHHEQEQGRPVAGSFAEGIVLSSSRMFYISEMFIFKIKSSDVSDLESFEEDTRALYSSVLESVPLGYELPIHWKLCCYGCGHKAKSKTCLLFFRFA